MKKYLVFDFTGKKPVCRAIDDSGFLYWKLIGENIILTIDDLNQLIVIGLAFSDRIIVDNFKKIYKKVKNNGFEVLDDDDINQLGSNLLETILMMSLFVDDVFDRMPDSYYKLLYYTEYMQK